MESYIKLRDRLISLLSPVGTETVPLEDCTGRVLAERLTAAGDVPPFDRSPYDGYAFRSADLESASQDSPVTLKILEEVPAGAVPAVQVTRGTAVKVLTGAPVPPGADAVEKFEVTEYTDSTVTFFAPVGSGSNIVRAGEDVKKGACLAEAGTVIDPGLSASLAAQGVSAPKVYKKPVIGLISTGNELTELGDRLSDGKIYNSNRYSIGTALQKLGCEVKYLGLAGDDAGDIARLIAAGLQSCHGLVLTGGVSVGDYDMTPEAMERAGAELLARGVDLKPGMACAYGIKDGKPVCGLSGNPASSIINFYAVAAPAINRLCGKKEPVPREITVTLETGFKKGGKFTRLLRGTLDLSGGDVKMRIPGDQGNVVISSSIGCDVIAIVPPSGGPIPPGTKVKGFLI